MEKISFVINTAKNELEHVKLLLKSLRENLDRDDHEILVFVDSDNQGTVEHLKYIKPKFKNLKIFTVNMESPNRIKTKKFFKEK